MKYQLLQVGTDAEVFLRTIDTHTPKSVEGLIGGDKTFPLQVRGMQTGFMVQEDNVMPEFNIPPASSAQEFSNSIGKMLKYLIKRMRKHNLELDISSSLQFPVQELQTGQALTFGCEPDFCAWVDVFESIKEAQNFIDFESPLLRDHRTAAAHIHVSYLVDGQLPTNFYQQQLAVRAMDLFIGVPYITIDPDIVRRQIYGKAGAFRPKHYGHEYRVPGNLWIKEDKTRLWIFDQTKKALEFASEHGESLLNSQSKLCSDIRDCINSHNKEKAQQLILMFNL